MLKISKTQYIIETLRLLKNEFPDNPDFLSSFDKIIDTVYHTAPEIVSQRWNKIYNFCVAHCNNSSNSAHINAYTLYHKRVNEYIDLYGNIN